METDFSGTLVSFDEGSTPMFNLPTFIPAALDTFTLTVLSCFMPKPNMTTGDMSHAFLFDQRESELLVPVSWVGQ